MFDALRAEFPRNAISWRAQSMNKDGTKALALAYIDARDVMNRLDEVCGPGGWQDRYEVHGAKTLCYLSVRIDGEWVTKADGAGDTDVEAEKGSISDAFKRAAVKWGIGRYLYDLDAPWVGCESRQGGNGKLYWSRWSEDPWSRVRQKPAPARIVIQSAPAPSDAEKIDSTMRAAADAARSPDELRSWWTDSLPTAKAHLSESQFAALKQYVADRHGRLTERAAA
jgi:hypothetical protein